MNKHLVLLFSTILLISSSLHAQFVRVGVKGGVNVSTVQVDKTPITLGTDHDLLIEQGEAKVGLHFGLVTRIQIMSLYIQPEILLTQSKGEIVITEITNGISKPKQFAEQKFNKLDIPVMIGWKFGMARLGFGPVASFMLSNEDGLANDIKNIAVGPVQNSYNRATFGYQLGAGLDLYKYITLDVKYEGNLSKLGNGLTISDKVYSFDQRNPQWIFSLGILF